MMCSRLRASLPLLAVLTVIASTSIAAQSASRDGRQVELTRPQLDSLLAGYESSAASNAYSSSMRDQARREASLIRSRLQTGDFQVGDQIALVVDRETSLSGNFVVQAGPALVLPEIGPITLAGVLRSELEPHLQRELARYLREPVVYARSSIRLIVTGGVGQAGYHVVPTNTVFTDVLMTAGGPTNSARLKDLRVERENRVIWQGEALQQAIIEGRTLDQLSIRAGDQIVVPVAGEGGVRKALEVAGMIVAPIVLLTTLITQVF
jgi:protein involved in polysaccharide export with SLBB domain